MYRSFVTCDDPKGIVECGRIRRSKSRPERMEPKIERGESKKKANASLPRKMEKEEMVSKGRLEEYRSPSSFELLQVSRGAQKLNQVIDSWSKGNRYDGNSEDMAKNLLKGALDLQESLHMLGKLQEASQCLSGLKKEKGKSNRLRMSEVTESVDSRSIRSEENYHMGFQNPQLSADGSLRDSIEELKKMIRESLAQQNLVPGINTEESTYFRFRGRNPDSALDIPSTSSSQSSMVQTSNFSTNSPISSTTSEKKAKGLNLVAKLMGLEEFPLKPLQTASKQLESEKIFNQQRPVFDMDMPRARKPPFLVQKKGSEQRSLQEILETMQFKGLLKGNSFKEPSSHSHDPFCRQRLLNNSTPIVLIKPLRDPWSQVQKPSVPAFGEERALNKETMLKKQRAKTEIPTGIINCEEGGSNSDRLSSREVAEETLTKGLSQARVKDSRMTRTRLDEHEVQTRQKFSSQMKTSGSVTQQPEKKQVIEKKSAKVQKLGTTSGKPVEKDIIKAKTFSRYQEQAKVTTIKPCKLRNGPNVAKKRNSWTPSTASNSISTGRTQAIVRGNSEKKESPVKKEKPVSKPKAAEVNTQNLGHEGDDKRINLTTEHDSVLVGEGTKAEAQKSTEGTESSENQIGEHCNDDQSSISEIMPLTTESESETKSSEVDDQLSLHEIDGKSFTSGSTLEALLLSNPDFLSHAKELFDLNMNAPNTIQIHRTTDSTDTQERLSHDGANEIIQCRGASQMTHPLSPNLVRLMRIHISPDQLLDEVCYGIEMLKCYSELASKNNPTDNLHAMLERDIKHKEVSTGMWDLGWRNGFSMDDIAHIVNDIETRLLTTLVEEIVA
ncbi:hypothetical protein SLE2022_160610 [Rubroshorea leprosula]